MPPATPEGKFVLFHVGLPKAASTFLQKRVFPAVSDATFLNITSMNAALNQKVRSSSTAFLGDPQKSREVILKTKSPKVIISAEGFVGDAYQSFLDHDAKARALKAIWPEAAILLVIRRQDRFCQSLFGQALRKGFPYSPARFLRLDGGTDSRNTLVRHFDYRAVDLDRLIATYEELFGEDRVFVIPLELLAADRSAFLEQIRSIGGFALPALEDAPSENTSYSPRGYRAARLLNRLCIDESEPGRRLLAWLDRKAAGGGLFWRLLCKATRISLRRLRRLVRLSVERIDRSSAGAARALTETQLSTIRAFYAQSNRRLAERRSLALEQYGYF